MNERVIDSSFALNENETITISFTVNEEQYELQVKPTVKLITILREQLNLIGPKVSCGIGRCGACSVFVDGQLVNGCLLMAYQVNGKHITTIEGLVGVTIDEVQQAFLKEGGFQCGYCTSGMIMAVKSLLSNNPEPTEADIKEALAGNLCRCTGYGGIIRAIQSLRNQKLQ